MVIFTRSLSVCPKAVYNRQRSARMKKEVWFKTVRVVVVLLISVTIAIVLVQLRPRAEKIEQVSDVRLVAVVPTHSETLPMIIQAYGTVQAREQLQLTAQARGQVVAMHPAFVEGGWVPSGERLLEIDPRDYELAVRQTAVGILQVQAELEQLEQEVRNLEALLHLARSETDLALADVNRLKKLVGKDMTSLSALEKTERQYLSSRERVQVLENQLAVSGPGRTRLESRLEAARVAMQLAQLDLERCRIHAPFAAWVTHKAVETGQYLVTGQPVGSIYRADAFDVEIKIPIGDLAWFPETVASGEGLTAEVWFTETTPPKRWRGRVARIKAALDATTRTLPVVIEIDQPDPFGAAVHPADRIKPGMFVTVRLSGRPVEQIHRLPRHLIHDGDTVYLAVDNQLTIRPVTVLRRFETEALISAGLSDGDLVITTPLSGAVSGMAVRLTTEN